MKFFERRRWKKLLAQLWHDAHHVRHMRGDIAPEAQLEELTAAENDLREAWEHKNEEELTAAATRINAAISAIYPPVRFPRIRENVEVFVVALAVAMAFRTYFIQPFKIPTGSMQPTLHGIIVKPQNEKGIMDQFPLNLVSLAFFGQHYSEVKAQTSGEVKIPAESYDQIDDSYHFYIGGIPHSVKRGMTLHFKRGEKVNKGQILATGRIIHGDHIFVDKVRYNFSRPKRGNIIVFSTDQIDYPNIRPNTFYIKRLAALPGETVNIDPPYLVINGHRITSPYPFKRLVTGTNLGYYGYTLANENKEKPSYLCRLGQTRTLEPGHYLPLGDNSAHSLDGRYFGTIEESALVGPAFVIYWPLSKRWGLVK